MTDRIRSRAARRRGMTLLEAVIAMAVMSIGVTALFGLLDYISRATGNLRFDAVAADAYAEVAAQIRDAACEFDPSNPGMLTLTDPGLNPAVGDWVGGAGPVPGSTIQAVGESGVHIPDRGTNVRVDYFVRNNDAGGWGAAWDPAWEGTSFQVEVRIREITGDPARDDPDRVDGYWIKVYPVQKRCVPRDPTSVGRGTYQ